MLLVNANRNQERYAEITGCRVVGDREGGYAGPLAGMASAMEAAGTRFLLTAPCDAPLVAEHLGPRLYEALVRERAQLSVAHDGERLQPVFALLDCSLLGSLLAYLSAGERKIDRWYARHRMARADFSDLPQSFSNINTPEERAALEHALKGDGSRFAARSRADVTCDPATLSEPAPAVAQGTSGKEARSSRPFPSFPHKREST